jgi:hypothetical protein
MKELNNSSLRDILSSIYNVDQKYIVPKIGFWYNPTSLEDKPKTWIGYNILRNAPYTLPEYEDEDGKNYVKLAKECEIDLQFIGSDAEDLANNVATWLFRQDVIDELLTIQGKLMAKGMQAFSSDYTLDGLNMIKAWNVKIYIAWLSYTATAQVLLTSADIRGTITI